MYFGPAETDLRKSVNVVDSRWRIETEFETEKSDVGLDEYETRTSADWHHHTAKCLLGGAFPLGLRQECRQGCPEASVRRCTGWCVRAAPGTVRMSCQYGWRVCNYATSVRGAPIRSANAAFH